MSQCVSIYGFLGTVTLEDYTFLGDPLVHPAWTVAGHTYASLPGFGPDPAPVGLKEGDGGAIMTLDDRSKGVMYDERGFAVTLLIVDNMTMETDDGESAYIRLQATQLIRFINGFDFRETAVKGYICLLQDSATENGAIEITAAGTTPGDLYSYGAFSATNGWRPSSLPGQTLAHEEFRIRYKDAKITNNPLFPAGLGQKTFDDLQYRKVFTPLR